MTIILTIYRTESCHNLQNQCQHRFRNSQFLPPNQNLHFLHHNRNLEKLQVEKIKFLFQTFLIFFLEFYLENSQPSPVFRDNFVINNNKKSSSSDQFEAMRQFTRSSLKDITNIKKTSTPSQKVQKSSQSGYFRGIKIHEKNRKCRVGGSLEV